MPESAAYAASSSRRPVERRRTRRFRVGVPVRLQIDGVPFASTVELWDVSLGGCYVRGDATTPAVLGDQAVAIGFRVPARGVALARGRVVREGDAGFAVSFDHANDAFAAFVLDLNFVAAP
jgi:hypothetical protein